MREVQLIVLVVKNFKFVMISAVSIKNSPTNVLINYLHYPNFH